MKNMQLIKIECLSRRLHFNPKGIKTENHGKDRKINTLWKHNPTNVVTKMNELI